MNKKLNVTGPEKFWSNVAVGEADQCWPWKKGVNSGGYGDCKHNGLARNASRVAYILSKGEPPAGHVVCHACDNPRCCNPSHLWTGTTAENLADCRRKGRAKHNCPPGVDHPRYCAKLTPEIIKDAIRRHYELGESQSSIARSLGVNSGTISRAVRGVTFAGLVK